MRTQYGFKKFRSTADAMDTLHRCLSRDCSPQWTLEGDIKGCFNHIKTASQQCAN